MGPLLDNLLAAPSQGAPSGVADEPGADLAQLRADLDALAEAVGTLVDLVQDVRGGGAAPGEAAPCRWAWRFAAPEVAAALWDELRDFVDWLNSRYALDSERQIPPCWYRHPVAVEELTALMCSWQAVYHGPDTPRDALLAWHAHWLWPCVDRLPDRAGWQRCRGGSHQERASTIHRTDDGFAEYTARTAPASRS